DGIRPTRTRGTTRPRHLAYETNPPRRRASTASTVNASGNEKRPHRYGGAFPLFHVVSGGVLLSHTVSRAVPSALEGLTSGFGMGPGVSPPPKPPKRITPPPSRARKSLVPEPQRLPSSLITAPPAAPRLGSRLFSGNRTGTRTPRSDRCGVC